MARTKQKESGNWIDLFKGSNLCRTEIAMVSICAQLVCGDPFDGNPIYFFQQVGVSDLIAFLLGLGNSAINLASDSLAFFAMSRPGLWTLYLWGLAALSVHLFVIGSLAVTGDRGDLGKKWGIPTVVNVSFSYDTNLVEGLSQARLSIL